MAWKPKTVLGKILKGAVTIGGTALAIGTGVGAIAGVAKGAGLLAGALSGVKKVASIAKGGIRLTAKTVDTVGKTAANLVTGTTKEQRLLVREQKQETAAEMAKIKIAQKLIDAGATKESAIAKVGLTAGAVAGLLGFPSDTEPTTEEQSQFLMGAGGMDLKKILPVVGIIAAAFLLFGSRRRR